MRKTTITFLLFCLTISLLAQNKPVRSFTAKNLNKKFELFSDEFNMQFVIVRDLNETIIKKIEIDKGRDPFYFGEIYKGDRNFVIIVGRYRFYILNLTNNRLIGPLSISSMRGQCREDAQSGSIGLFQILNNGQYLIFKAIDLGVFCYSLVDLYNPKDVPFFKSDSTFWKGNFIFIDKRKENIFNAISSSIDGNYSKDIKSSMLFRGFRFQLDEEGNLKSRIENGKYLVLEQIRPDSQIHPLIIDMDEGVIVKDMH